MWSRSAASLVRTGLAMVIAGLVAGCFQPMYGDRTLTGSSATMRSSLAAVDVAPITGPPGTSQARLGIELRNDLTFAFNGGGASLPPTHELRVRLRPSSSSMIVDPTTARAEYSIEALDATYSLVEIATKKVLFTSNATARASFDAPGQQQRYAMLRGQRDAEQRVMKIIAEQIRNRVASHFVAGG